MIAAVASFASPAPGAETSAAITIDVRQLLDVPSQWQDYFGVHYSTEEAFDELHVQTIRGYDGPHVELFPAKEGGGEDLNYRNPFGQSQSLELAAMKSRRVGAKGLDVNVPAIVNRRATVIYPVLAVPSLIAGDKLDQAAVYGMCRRIYGRFRRAADHVMLQWGNEVNGKHLGNATPPRITGTAGKFAQLVNRPEDAVAYSENFLAPALEAVRRASTDIYGDPGRIKAVSGSFANIYSAKHRQWMYQVLDHVVDSETAPSLRGKPIWASLDILTVHYPFAHPTGGAVLQEIWDRYGVTRRLHALWITEEHGRKGNGGFSVLDRSMRYLIWVAANQLNADQTRLCWWHDNEDALSVREAIKMLGDGLADGKIRVAHFPQNAFDVYLLENKAIDKLKSETYVLVAVPRAGGRVSASPTFRLVGGVREASSWVLSAVQFPLNERGEQVKAEMSNANGEPAVAVEGRVRGALLAVLTQKMSHVE